MWGMPIEWDHDINNAYNTATTATATGSGLSGWLDTTTLYPANDWRHAAELFQQSGAGLWLFNEDGEQIKPFDGLCDNNVTMNRVDNSFVPASAEEVEELYAREEGPDASFK